MEKHDINVSCSAWQQFLDKALAADEMQALLSRLNDLDSKGEQVLPHKSDRFKAFDKTPFENVKCVIIGQDPYHSEGINNPCIAMGLSFSVPRNEKIPPSLRNIYKELQRDLGIEPPMHGDLTAWAEEEGVLLLNTTLTVEQGKAGSHSKLGWQQLTQAAIDLIDEQQSNCVFMLWGNHAKKVGQKIDRERHLVLETSHPSPLGARHGFNGCKHFSKANNYLSQHNRSPVNWAAIQS